MSAVLEALGFPPPADLIYRGLLRCPQTTADLMREFGEQGPVSEALDCMLRSSLVRFSHHDPAVVEAIDPQLALGTLLAQREAEVRHHEQQIAGIRASLDRLVDEYRWLRAERSELEEIHGGAAVAGRIKEQAGLAAHEVRCLGLCPTDRDDPVLPQALSAVREAVPALVARGVCVRAVGFDSSRRRAGTQLLLESLRASGARVRTTPAVTTWMVVFDATAALVPCRPLEPGEGVVVVRGAGLLSVLSACFEQTWLNATALDAAAPRPPSGLRPEQLALLRLLAEGVTDEVAARRLGVSLRTIRRWASELADRLNARSRFQAGLRARERGWI
jgi:DNA-binding CsgD family transcriptional regulator